MYRNIYIYLYKSLFSIKSNSSSVLIRTTYVRCEITNMDESRQFETDFKLTHLIHPTGPFLAPKLIILIKILDVFYLMYF